MALSRRGRQAQQFGTDFEARLFGGVITDLKTDFTVLKEKINHAPGLDELVGFAHGQYAGLVQAFHDLFQVLLFRGADE